MPDFWSSEGNFFRLASYAEIKRRISQFVAKNTLPESPIHSIKLLYVPHKRNSPAFKSNARRVSSAKEEFQFLPSVNPT